MEHVDELIIQLKRLLPPGTGDGFAKPATRKQTLSFIKAFGEAKKIKEELEKTIEERDALLAVIDGAIEEMQP
jgi:hypothetical protein